MPLLGRKSEIHAASPESEISLFKKAGLPVGDLKGVENARSKDSRRRAGIFEACANPGCSSGWIHLWRSRSVPVFEDGWTCSANCMRMRIQAALAREMDGRATLRTPRRHRIPLGLLMLEQGWISQTQLRCALDAQKSAGTGRLGSWLVRQRAVSEESITRALALQWSCPVMSLDGYEAATLTAVMPRFLIDAFGALPLRLAASQVLYLGFEESLDPVLALAVERMTGLRVETGVVRESLFRPAHRQMLDAIFASVELVEAVSQAAAAHALAKSVERARPIASRLVRVHDCLWLRMWLHPQNGALPEIESVQDIVCSIGGI
jgi:Type II secretion system (T2SS), protein E, N-terminal domain